MNSVTRACLLVRSCVQLGAIRCARRGWIVTRLYSSADTQAQTGLRNNNNFASDISVQSYNMKMTNFASRLGYRLEELPSVLTALTTKSFVDLFPSPETTYQYNGRLSLMGRSVMLLFVQEQLYCTYPELPGDALSDISLALTSHEALTTLCKCLDVTDIVRATVDVTTDNPSQFVSNILSDVILAIISALYCDQGAHAVRKFVVEFVLSELEQRDLEEMAKLEHPKQTLRYILNSQGKPQLMSRLLEKNDEDKYNPMFTVGVYSMNRLLAEGTGSSLARAENKAVKTALLQRFSKDLHQAPLPSHQENFLTEDKIEIFEANSTAET